MAVRNQSCLLLCTFPFLFISAIPFSSSQSNSQNLETFYPFPILSPPPAPSPSNSSIPPINPFFPPTRSPESSPQVQEHKSSSNRKVVTAVAATAASTFVVATLLFFLIQRFVIVPRRKKKDGPDAGRGTPVVPNDQFGRTDGNVRALIVDENGLDVLYWRKLEGGDVKKGLHKEVLYVSEGEDEEGEPKRKSEPMQEIPLLRGKSSSSHHKVVPEMDVPSRIVAPNANIQSAPAGIAAMAIEKPNLTSQPPKPPLPPPPASPPQPPLPPPTQSSMAVPKAPTPPAPPPIPAKKGQPPPPPPLKAAGSASSSKQASVPKAMGSDSEPGNENGQVKMKPLHWDKVNKNPDRSMVWDKIGGGSFR